MSVNGGRPRILVLNQYYWPGVEATAHLLTELCEALADEFDITVVTGRSRVRRRAGRRGARTACASSACSSTAYDRSQLGRRAANYVTYLAASRASRLCAQAGPTSCSA